MSLVLNPEETRNRKNFEYPVPKPFSHILDSSVGPRLQMQYNDENNKCIGESMILKPENHDLHGTSFIPRCSLSDERLKIPANAKSILIFGQQGLFASQNDLKSAYENNQRNTKPTQTIEVSGPFYLSKRPYLFIIAQFDLETGQRNNLNYVKDIIKTIEFSNNSFSKVSTIEPINVIR